MYSRLVTLIAATTVVLAALLVAAAAASAHELQVLKPGSAEIDLGSADPARLVHATLVASGDELVVTVTPGDAPVEVTLLVPDRTPESGYAAEELPTLGASWSTRGVPSTATATGVGAAIDEPITDDATGIAYREVARTPLERATGAVTIVITRGSAPTRVALRVGPPTTFAASDPERTPRAALDTRLWAETPPPGTAAATETAADAEAIEPRYAWYGAIIGALGVLVAIWWVARGRAESRRSGIERAELERAEREQSEP